MSSIEITKKSNTTVIVGGGATKQTVEVHDPGVAGPPNVLSVGDVSVGYEADVTITGQAPNQTINFVLPVGNAYSYGQYPSSAEWVITHNLGYKPGVTVVDTAGSVIEGTINYTDDNSLVLLFSAPFAGTAYLS